MQHARDDEFAAVDPVIDAMFARRDRAHTLPEAARYTNLGIVEQTGDRGVDIAQIRLGDFGAVRGHAIIEDTVDIADGGGAVYRLQRSPWRAKPRAMMSSIVVSTTGDANPSSIAACNAASFSA